MRKTQNAKILVELDANEIRLLKMYRALTPEQQKNFQRFQQKLLEPRQKYAWHQMLPHDIEK